MCLHLDAVCYRQHQCTHIYLHTFIHTHIHTYLMHSATQQCVPHAHLHDAMCYREHQCTRIYILTYIYKHTHTHIPDAFSDTAVCAARAPLRCSISKQTCIHLNVLVCFKILDFCCCDAHLQCSFSKFMSKLCAWIYTCTFFPLTTRIHIKIYFWLNM